MRKAGVLLHISSLPGEFGCGTFGRHAFAFADFLHAAGFRIWQVLPFNVPHRDASPYSSVSTFAQNPLFIDPDLLANEGLLLPEELAQLRCEAPALSGDFFLLAQHREPFLRSAAKRANAALRQQVEAYLQKFPRVREACLYLAKEDPCEENLFYYAFLQYQFAAQWGALHDYLQQLGIEVIGDIPIYADLHSSEVHFNPDCFLLDENGTPLFVSGVPGDSFNDAGQKWGHPLYNTKTLAAQNYGLLFDRMAFSCHFYDVTRIDHFQAIGAYYAIPVNGHPREGHWECGVGEPFVKRLAQEIGKERFIVEDFDCFPGGSHALAVKYGFPDMQTLQFTLGAGKKADTYPEKTVAYTGTHDNNTMLGYLQQISPKRRRRIARLLGLFALAPAKTIAKAAARHLCSSPAQRVVLPVQDLLLEDARARMNVPGISGHGNWHYRMTQDSMKKLQKSAPSWRKTLQASNRLEEQA